MNRRPMKLELLDRALLKAKAANGVGHRLRYVAGVANTWCDLGEVEKARKLVAETLPVAKQYTEKTDIYRGFFAAALARFDLPAAMAMANEFSGRQKDRILGLMAIQLASTNPAEAERLWNEVRGTLYKESLEGCWRLALSDPIRARRIATKAAQHGDANYYIVLALGLVPRDKAAARDALQQGLDQVDQLMDDPMSEFRVAYVLRIALEVVDQIDSGLAADVFWRYLATRPGSVDPRSAVQQTSSLLIGPVARYDRHIARVLFEPIRARMVRAEDSEPGAVQPEFEAWTMLDPAAAIAAAEKLPINPDRLDAFGGARLQVASALINKETWKVSRPNGILDFLPQP